MQSTHPSPMRPLVSAKATWLPYRPTPYCRAPCECAICQNSLRKEEDQSLELFAYKKVLSWHEASATLQRLVNQEREDREYITSWCRTHGDQILKRWKKASRDKREAWLFEVEPAMFERRFFHFVIAYFPSWRDSLLYRRAYLMPYVSVEHFKTDPSALLSMLRCRTLYTPEEWAPFDSEGLRMAWAAGLMDVDYSDMWVTMHSLQYGTPTIWDPDLAHRMEILGFPRAHLILEGQAQVMAFLRGMVDKILQGVDLDRGAGSTKWKQATRQGFKKIGEIAFRSQYTSQSLCSPPTLDISILRTKVRAQINQYADHLHLLQTDSAYLRRYIKLINDNAVLKSAEVPDSAQHVVGELMHTIETYLLWQHVCDEIDNVERLYWRHRNSIDVGEPLPKSYDMALGALEALLTSSVHAHAAHMAGIVPQRPDFRHKYHFNKVRGSGVQMVGVHMKCKSDFKVETEFREDPLDWWMLQLESTPAEQRRFDYAELYDFLDAHLSNSSAKERARLDEVLLGKLSHHAAIVEMFEIIHLHRPRVATRTLEDILEHDDRKAWRYRAGGYLLIPTNQEYKRPIRLLETLLAVSGPQFSKPEHKLQHFDRETTTMQDFWKSIRDMRRMAYIKVSLPCGDMLDDLQLFSVLESQEYLDSVQRKREFLVAEVDKANGQAGSSPLKIIPRMIEAQALAVHERTQERLKIKTRPKDSHVPLDTVCRGVEIASVNEHRIHVKQQPYGMLVAMFPAAGAKTTKSVDWSAFVRAMADAGFPATNNGGSAVVFMSERDDESRPGGRIIFHRPHPEPKIDPVMLQSMGKRMSKWFGWQRDLFVPDSKEDRPAETADTGK